MPSKMHVVPTCLANSKNSVDIVEDNEITEKIRLWIYCEIEDLIIQN
ncbi:hypothetical protein DSUL_200009 [Desulfovibrionales bacterium]